MISQLRRPLVRPVARVMGGYIHVIRTRARDLWIIGEKQWPRITPARALDPNINMPYSLSLSPPLRFF